jgi:hypothetical protein
MADTLAGLRANDTSYLKNKYDHDFVVSTPAEDPETLAWIEEILSSERDLHFASPALQASGFAAGESRGSYLTITSEH